VWEQELKEAEEMARVYDLKQEVKEIQSKMSRRMVEGHLNMILRVTVCFKNIGLFESEAGN
jgi:hypothetical protein